jgi:protein-S-isoprenylcysteine O-methyltransferase Ste14
MSEEVRLTVIALSLIFVVVGGYYRIQSQRSGESLDRRMEGWPLLIGIRATGLLVLGSIAAWLYNPPWFEPVTVPITESARWLGVACFGCAVAWLLWMFHTLGRNLTDTVVTRRNATFVDYGPYRFIRNPMYTGILMVGLSLGLVLGTWLVPAAAGLMFTLLALRTKTEEKYLIERFGNQYRDYMARVGRFLPKRARVNHVLAQPRDPRSSDL